MEICILCPLSSITLSAHAASWTSPLGKPPSNNVDAPLHVGADTQTKVGALGVYGLFLAGASQYINFGVTLGSAGYGIRNNAGKIEFKDSGGVWAPIATTGAQWTVSGSDVYRPAGKVGVGTAVPSSPLTVSGLIETNTPSGGIKFPDGTIQTTAYIPPAPKSPCSLPWGGVLYEGQSIKAYRDAVMLGLPPVSEIRTCTSGVLSGSYTKENTRGDFYGAGASAYPNCGTGGACSFESAADFLGGDWRRGRFLITSGLDSANKRCRELGYQTGTVRSVYTSAEWCGTYSNARTKSWNGTTWVMGGCENSAVKEASCYP